MFLHIPQEKIQEQFYISQQLTYQLTELSELSVK